MLAGSATSRPLRGGVRLRFALLVTMIGLLAAAVALVGVPKPADVATAVADLGALGPVVVIVSSAMLLAALVPRSVLAAAAGLVFGPLLGAGYILAGAAVGALVAFALGRLLGRDFLATRRRLARLDRWLTDRGIWAVVLLRLLPVAPFGLVSYGFGTTGIRVRHYLLGTAIGVAPSTLVFAYLGAAAMAPGSPAFLLSLLAAAVLVAASAITHAALRRRAVDGRPARASRGIRPS